MVFACFYFRVTCKRKETQRISKKITALIPGAALALGIACIAKWLETLESSAGLHLIGASVIALFIGMAINGGVLLGWEDALMGMPFNRAVAGGAMRWGQGVSSRV